MMHRCCRQSAEAKHAAALVAMDQEVDRVSLQQRAAFRGRNSKDTAQLRLINRLTLCDFPVKRKRDSLLLRREGWQMRLPLLPVLVECGGLGHQRQLSRRFGLVAT